MKIDIQKENGYFVGVLLDEFGCIVGRTRKCHDRKEVQKQARKLSHG